MTDLTIDRLVRSTYKVNRAKLYIMSSFVINTDQVNGQGRVSSSLLRRLDTIYFSQILDCPIVSLLVALTTHTALSRQCKVFNWL